MSKRIVSLTVYFSILSVLLTQTQNCAKVGDMASGQAEFKSLSPGPIAPVEPSPVIPGKTVVQTNYQPVLADRVYLTNLLKDIFGPTAMSADSTRTDLKFQDHGSPCSFYRNHNIKKADGTYAEASVMDRCTRISPDLLTAPLMPKATVTRQALLTHACSDLVTNATTFAYALKKVGNGVPAANEANILKAYRLFYRSHPEPHKGLVESLLVMLPPAGVTANDWRVVFNAICSSSYWQAI
jgi:hypothetical protein